MGGGAVFTYSYSGNIEIVPISLTLAFPHEDAIRQYCCKLTKSRISPFRKAHFPTITQFSMVLFSRLWWCIFMKKKTS